MAGTGLENGVTSVDEMLRVYPAFLFGTPLGIAGVCASIIVMVLTFVGDRIKWVWIALAIYMTSLGVVRSYDPSSLVANNLLPPFSQLRDLNRPVAIFLLLMLAMRACLSQAGIRSRTIGAPLRAYFFFQIFTCVMFIAGVSSIFRGVFGGIVFTLIFASFGIGLGRWLTRLEDAYSALRTVLATGALLVFGVACHLLISPHSIYTNGRLTGTTGNPQFLGAFLAFMLPTCYGLLFKRDEPKTWRIIAAGNLGLSVAFILLTGSRSAVIVSIVGILVYFRRRLGQFLGTSLLAIVMLFVVAQLFGIGDRLNSQHLYSTDNSRAEVWGRLWDEFLSHPVFGMGNETAAGESSYFSVPAVYGLVGCIPFAIAIWLILRDSVRIVQKRRSLGRHAVLADIAVATLAQILVSGVFDNHLLAMLSPAVFLIYIFLAIYALLLDPVVSIAQPDGFDASWNIEVDPFGDVFTGEGLGQMPRAIPFNEPLRHFTDE